MVGQKGSPASTVALDICSGSSDRWTQGLEWGGAGRRLRCRGAAASPAELATALPLEVISPESHSLVDGAPEVRRAFLDRRLFHVEQDFWPEYRRFRKALAQRNAALGSGAPGRSVQGWDAILVESGERLTRWRADTVSAITQPFKQILETLSPRLSVSLGLNTGWSEEDSLAETLVRHLETDRGRGFTGWGPHRADLKIRVETGQAKGRVSRGQQKLIAAALTMAAASGAGGAILLVDDLLAELDDTHAGNVVSLIENSGTQVFLTATARGRLEAMLGSAPEVFHVEHGVVKPAASS